MLNILGTLIRFIPYLLYEWALRPLNFLAFRFNPPLYFKLASSEAKFLLACLGIKLSVQRREMIPKTDRAFLIASNHQSYLDIPILSSIVPTAFIQRPIPFIPGVSWHFGKLSLVIERENPISLFRAIKYITKVALEQKIPVAMFPESTRSVTGALGELRLGAAVIVKKLDLPVLPISIYNSRELLPKGSNRLKRGRVLVTINPMIEQDYIKNHSVEEINAEIRSRLQAGLDRLGDIKGKESARS